MRHFLDKYDYSQKMTITFTTHENGETTEETLTFDTTDLLLADMLKIFYKVLLFQTYGYVEDLIAVSGNTETSAWFGGSDYED
jgi:hypothetical protein